MNNSVTIESMYDEHSGTPIFQVSDESGNATNCVTLDDAMETARRWVVPLKPLKQLVTEWVQAHGTIWYDNNGVEFCEEMGVDLTEEQLDRVAHMVQSAQVTVTIPEPLADWEKELLNGGN